MKNQNASGPSLVPIRSGPHVELPSFEIAIKTMQRSSSMYWWIIGTFSSSFVIELSFVAVTYIPWPHDYLMVLNGLPWYLFGEVFCSIYFVAFSYLVLVSRLWPSKPLGCYVKQGFELFVLFAALLLMWFLEWGVSFPLVFSIIAHFHAYCQVRYHPPDLSNLDWILEGLMQIAIFWCGKSKYCIAPVVACLMAICFRFWSYSCPETSNLPVGYVEKLGSEKTC